MIFKNLIQANLKTEYLGKNIEYYQIIDSTNKEANELIKNNEALHGMMIITDNQKSGKGRSNKKWHMGPSKGLAMSLIYLKTVLYNNALLIPLAAGLSIAETLKNRGLNPIIKWPNDILINNKKIGGILCESKIQKNTIESFIIGIGLNINETINDFPENLKETATSLFIEKGFSFQRELICAIITTFLERYLQDLNSVIDQWLSYCNYLDKKVTFNFQGKKCSGIFRGINQKGYAIIKIGNDIKEFPSILIR